MFHNPRDTTGLHCTSASCIQHPDCFVESYLESREGEEGGGEGKGWEGMVAEGRGAEGANSTYGLDCCLNNPRENHGHSLVSLISFKDIIIVPVQK